MKKNLLIAAAVMIAAGANAQNMENSIRGQKFDKNAPMISALVDAPAKTMVNAPVKARQAKDIFGSHLQIDLASDQTTSQAQGGVTMSETELSQEGYNFNVLIENFWANGTKMYAQYDEATGELRIPSQVVAESTKSLGYTNEYGRLEILAINSEDKVSMGDLVFIEQDGKFELADTLKGYYIYALDYQDEETGETGAGWSFAFNTKIVDYNGTMSFYTTAKNFQTEKGDGWKTGELSINYEDLETAIIINGFVGSGCVQIDLYDDGTCEMEMGQPVSADKYVVNGVDYGMMHICYVDIIDEEGHIGPKEDVEVMEGTYKRNVEQLNGGTVIYFYEADSEGKVTKNNYWLPKTNTVGEGKDANYYWMGGYFCVTDFILNAPDASGISEKTMTRLEKLQSTKTYNMMGQQVDRRTAKGLLVRDGKKYIGK